MSTTPLSAAEIEDLRAFDKRAGTLLDELSPDEFLRRWIG